MTLASTVWIFRRGPGESQFSEQISQLQSHTQGLWIICFSSPFQRSCPLANTPACQPSVPPGFLLASIFWVSFSCHFAEVIVLLRDCLMHYFLMIPLLSKLLLDVCFMRLAPFFCSFQFLNFLQGKVLLLCGGTEEIGHRFF